MNEYFQFIHFTTQNTLIAHGRHSKCCVVLSVEEKVTRFHRLLQQLNMLAWLQVGLIATSAVTLESNWPYNPNVIYFIIWGVEIFTHSGTTQIMWAAGELGYISCRCQILHTMVYTQWVFDLQEMLGLFFMFIFAATDWKRNCQTSTPLNCFKSRREKLIYWSCLNVHSVLVVCF